MVYYRLREGAPAYGRPAKRFKATSQTVDKQLIALKRKVKQFEPEVKMIGINQSMTNVQGGVGDVLYISGIVQGTNYSERLGHQVRPVYMELNLTVSGLTASSVEPISVYLIKDKQSDGTVPDLSGASNSVFFGNTPISGVRNPLTRDRFTVLRQWDFTAVMINSGNMCNLMKWRIPLTGVTEYIGTSAAQTSSQKNQYYLMCSSSETANTLDVTCFGILKYTDA